jgi:YVTN family beta-propeller protein
VVIFDAATGAEVGRVALEGGTYPYEVVISPDGADAFVTLWNERQVVPIDIAGATAGTPILVEKNPEGMALSADGTTLVVANADSDSLSVIDVAMRAVVATVDIHGETAPNGASPSAGAFGPDGRLYVVNAGDNAVDVFERAGLSFTRIGRIPALWYPTHVVARATGDVLILNGKSFGSGPNTDPGTMEITRLMAGSMSVIPAAEITPASLTAWENEVATNNDRATRFGGVDCPAGAPYDFPIPQPGGGPSTLIDQVILVIRENKTYDAYFGALVDAAGAPHGNGDPTLTIVPVAETEQVFPNTLELARQFAIGDNYYSGAEQSIQGHVWTVHGRTTDFVERSWLTTWGRNYWRVPPQGILQEMGSPEEGSIFDYLTREGIGVTNYGELVGSSQSASPAAGYPGSVYTMEISDVEKAEFVGRQARVRCRLEPFTYAVMPNDHTFGRQAGRPTPRAMIADNDSGMGVLADRISHSSFWPRTVIFMIQDDPQDGGDHVDNHRAPLIVISPWVKRGYVSSVHYNESSIYRTIQLILGIDEPLNAYWANAAPMYDLFTSTPDYTPYTNIPRRWPEDVNPADGSALAAMSARWDFSVPDEQPGLSRMLWRHLRGTEPPWSPEIPVPGGEEEDEDD